MSSLSLLISTMLTLTLTTGCSIQSAKPQLIGIHYFYIGDTECSGFTLEATNLIHCFTNDGTYTGLRTNMTSEQLEMYRHYESLERQRRLMQDKEMMRLNLR